LRRWGANCWTFKPDWQLNFGLGQEQTTMRWIRNGKFLLVITIGLSYSAWGQGSSSQAGRGAAAQQAGAAGRGARAGGGGGAGAGDFYNYDTTAGAGMAIPDTQPVETHQKIIVDGEALAYSARVGYMPLRNATTGQSEAHLFFTCYAKDGVADASARPIMFFLGSTPGVAASWQEFGGLGPKRMKWMGDGTAGLPPYGWADNPSTLLGQADLVFVNPVGTAFSRPDQPSRGPNFWNTATDTASLGEFVRSFINTYDRRNSPLFLAGEDFGTGRAAGLASYLNEHQIPVHGVVLFSMTMAADAVAGDEQYITLLPSLIMAAWYHKKLAPELNALGAEQIAEQARQFAAREYLHALYKGDRMTPEERTKVVADLSRLTGLSKAFIVNNNLRITLDRFNGELLRDQHRALSYSDARVTGYVPAAGGGGRGGFGGGAVSAIDYNLSNLAGGFLAAYEAYLRRELTFTGNSNGIFYLLSGGIGAFTSTGNDDASLAGAFARNPRLHLFVGVNFFDLNAPFYATEFTLAHLNVSPEVRAHNITVSHFEAGQMTYVDNKSLAKLHVDLGKFINETMSSARQ
jgi:carboxypeptidase C (cathepsin A)